jgi:hypothetical protein
MSQKNSLNDSIITNDCGSILEKQQILIKYRYDLTKNIHDYSGNWDFDKDGIMDSLILIPSNSVNITYSPIIILSSNQKLCYNKINIDIPCFSNYRDFNSIGGNNFSIFQFSVDRSHDNNLYVYFLSREKDTYKRYRIYWDGKKMIVCPIR